MKKKILFVCIHNSARSQMAEAFVNRMAPDHFEAVSAGIEPGALNPFVVQVMKEIGIDISGNRVKSVDEFIRAGSGFDFLITVCDEASAERCPRIPGQGTRLHMGFADPSAIAGTAEEKLLKTREIRDAIRDRLRSWLKEQGVRDVRSI